MHSMLPGAQPSLTPQPSPPPSRPPSPYRPNHWLDNSCSCCCQCRQRWLGSCWTEETFTNSDEAEAALCEDRSAFVRCNDIMPLIPGHIKKCMIHSDAIAQIRGFQDLFIYLNKDSSPIQLRQLVKVYFIDRPPLRGYLSQLTLSLLLSVIILVDIRSCRTSHSSTIPRSR